MMVQDGTKLVGLEWLERNVPCQMACPVRTNAGGYCALIAQGRDEEAYSMAAAPNPLAAICGYVCAAPCEEACRRGSIDSAVAIRALKRFVAERYGVYSKIGRQQIVDQMRQRKGHSYPKVAVVGAGPAGLSAAHDLSRYGFPVTVFESAPVGGGMLYLGIPEYRLPRHVIHAQVDYIASLGVEFQYGRHLGRDFDLEELRRKGYAAVFLAIGAHKSRELKIEGVQLDGVLHGVDFLLNANLNYRVDLGRRVVVIGGGNVALDVARSVLRINGAQEDYLSPENYLHAAMDIARSAVRFGAHDVDLVCLESRKEMPAFTDEVREAEAEGVRIHPSLGPKRILGQAGRVHALETIECASVFDVQGRFNPIFRPGSERLLEADTIILAIGQRSDFSFLRSADGIDVTPRGTIQVEPETLATTAPGVYAGGDVAFGPRNVIAAVADGRKAALSILRRLDPGLRPETRVSIFVFPHDSYSPPEDFDRVLRQPVPSLPVDRRVGVAEVELGYGEAQARLEGSRCLRCWINTIFEGNEREGSECILCGGCVDVCPEECIELVSLESLYVDSETRGAFEAAEGPLPEDATLASVMLKDEERCIRCGLCEARCPVDCITMEEFLHSEVLVRT